MLRRTKLQIPLPSSILLSRSSVSESIEGILRPSVCPLPLSPPERLYFLSFSSSSLISSSFLSVRTSLFSLSHTHTHILYDLARRHFAGIRLPFSHRTNEHSFPQSYKGEEKWRGNKNRGISKWEFEDAKRPREYLFGRRFRFLFLLFDRFRGESECYSSGEVAPPSAASPPKGEAEGQRTEVDIIKVIDVGGASP